MFEVVLQIGPVRPIRSPSENENLIPHPQSEADENYRKHITERISNYRLHQGFRQEQQAIQILACTGQESLCAVSHNVA